MQHGYICCHSINGQGNTQCTTSGSLYDNVSEHSIYGKKVDLHDDRDITAIVDEGTKRCYAQETIEQDFGRDERLKRDATKG